MVEGANNVQRIAGLSEAQRQQKAMQEKHDHMESHLRGILEIADIARFGSDQDAKDALEKVVLACRCALK